MPSTNNTPTPPAPMPPAPSSPDTPPQGDAQPPAPGTQINDHGADEGPTNPPATPVHTPPAARRTRQATDLSDTEREAIESTVRAGLIAEGVAEGTIAKDLIIDGDVAHKAVDRACKMLSVDVIPGRRPETGEANVTVGTVIDALQDWYAHSADAPAAG